MPIKIGNYENFSLILLRMIRLITLLSIFSFLHSHVRKKGVLIRKLKTIIKCEYDDGSCTYPLDELQIKINPSYGTQGFYLDSSIKQMKGIL